MNLTKWATVIGVTAGNTDQVSDLNWSAAMGSAVAAIRGKSRRAVSLMR
ncbi:MAG: hypothetical protein ACLR17_18905 [Enterobacteriaceae bacterium]